MRYPLQHSQQASALPMKHVVITGGAGYIGSHTTTVLLNAGFDVTIVDNLCNSQREVLDRIEKICGVRPRFVEGDIRDGALLDDIFAQKPVDAVIHFAGLKAVGESVTMPLDYYDNNIGGTLELLGAMCRGGVRTMVFSSSATVYGDPASVPIREDFPRSATNPYGRSKLVIEDILADLYHADSNWRIARLRYFNPVGAHESGLIGENPQGTPNNLMPFITQVAVGQQNKLKIFGNDYPTLDGTGVRDYIHVMDLAEGHLAALHYSWSNKGVLTANLGTGQGYSVLQMIKAFERVSGYPVPYEIVPRRSGDIAQCWADPTFAQCTLNWKAKRSLNAMCADAWRWQRMNPHGFCKA